MEPSNVLQYGAMGLLTLLLFWGINLLSKVVDRAIGAFDKLAESLNATNNSIIQLSHQIESNHHEVITKLIEASAKTSEDIKDISRR